MEAISTIRALFMSWVPVGQEVLYRSSLYDSSMSVSSFNFFIYFSFGTGREARTPDTWFWRPVLYRLSYFRIAGAKVV